MGAAARGKDGVLTEDHVVKPGAGVKERGMVTQETRCKNGRGDEERGMVGTGWR